MGHTSLLYIVIRCYPIVLVKILIKVYTNNIFQKNY
nr:MAG TPA: hypothetical protein [Caudoviricetes sp.]